MARHAGPKSQRSALLRVGLAVTAAGAALTGGAGAAQAAPAAVPLESGLDGALGNLDPAATGRSVGTTLGYAAAGGLSPVKDIHLNPLAGTGVDPLDNVLGTQVADFKPVSTAAVTGPLTRGDALGELPLVSSVTDLLPG